MDDMDAGRLARADDSGLAPRYTLACAERSGGFPAEPCVGTAWDVAALMGGPRGSQEDRQGPTQARPQEAPHAIENPASQEVTSAPRAQTSGRARHIEAAEQPAPCCPEGLGGCGWPRRRVRLPLEPATAGAWPRWTPTSGTGRPLQRRVHAPAKLARLEQ